METMHRVEQSVDPVIRADLILESTRVRLEPLRVQHAEELAKLAIEPDLWKWTQQRIDSQHAFDQWLGDALEKQSQGSQFPFAIVERKSGCAIGSTRFANVDRVNRRLEIGWTWIGLPFHSTGINAEVKYLMLRHAFETLQFVRVEFRANGRNIRSRAALLKLGAKEEGTFRSWLVDPDGKRHDAVWFSILDQEWPAVKGRLEESIGLGLAAHE